MAENICWLSAQPWYQALQAETSQHASLCLAGLSSCASSEIISYNVWPSTCRFNWSLSSISAWHCEVPAGARCLADLGRLSLIALPNTVISPPTFDSLPISLRNTSQDLMARWIKKETLFQIWPKAEQPLNQSVSKAAETACVNICKWSLGVSWVCCWIFYPWFCHILWMFDWTEFWAVLIVSWMFPRSVRVLLVSTGSDVNLGGLR